MAASASASDRRGMGMRRDSWRFARDVRSLLHVRRNLQVDVAGNRLTGCIVGKAAGALIGRREVRRSVRDQLFEGIDHEIRVLKAVDVVVRAQQPIEIEAQPARFRAASHLSGRF